jgi:ABC-type multidrug transport system fused ATPase/permease subunit
MRGIGAGVRIFDLLERKPAIDPEAGIPVDPNRRGPIRFEDVMFQYPSRKEVTVLKNLTLEINPGESVALV